MSRGGGPWSKLALLTPSRPRETPHGHDFAANVMHIDADSICANCLQWVTPHDIVRRTAFGLIQHESCTMVSPTDVSSERV
jgi:hypothetical protein